MPALTIYLSDELYNRLVDYARDEAGTTPARAVRDLLEELLAEVYERDPETGKTLYDSDDGHQVSLDYLNQMIPARHVERDYGKRPGTVRGYLRFNPALKASDDFRKEGHDWLVRREAAERIWGGRKR